VMAAVRLGMLRHLHTSAGGHPHGLRTALTSGTRFCAVRSLFCSELEEIPALWGEQRSPRRSSKGLWSVLRDRPYGGVGDASRMRP